MGTEVIIKQHIQPANSKQVVYHGNKIISKQHVQLANSKQVGFHGSKELVSEQQAHPASSYTYIHTSSE